MHTVMHKSIEQFAFINFTMYDMEFLKWELREKFSFVPTYVIINFGF